MDIVINSNVQSPLVRTLSATQGKSASFTHHIKDNVPPVSFTKITLTPDGGAVGTYNRNYKFKIPQYGYLRNFILKFEGSELGIGQSIMTDIYKTTTALTNVTLEGNNINYAGTTEGTTGISYPLKLLFGSNRVAAGSSTIAPTAQTFVPNGFVPPFEGLVRNGNMDPWASMWGRIQGGQNYQIANTTLATMTAYGDARITPYRHVPRFDALNAFGRNQFFIKSDTTIDNAYYQQDALGTVTDAGNIDWSVPVPFDGLEWTQITTTTTNFTTITADRAVTYFGDLGIAGNNQELTGGVIVFNATLPTTPYNAADTGSAPNVQLRNRYLGQRLMSTYDWCSQANLSRHLGALMPATVTLSTHNRVIQTLYPLETLARIYRMPTDQKRRFLSMIRPQITASPSSIGQNSWTFTNDAALEVTTNLIAGDVTTNVTWLRPAGTFGAQGGAFNTYRTFACYFPCFFSFFEDPSMNLDSRFVENLEIDVVVQNYDLIYAAEDLGANTANLGTPAGTAGTNGTNMSIATRTSRAPLVAYNGWHSSEFRQRVKVVNTSSVSVTGLCYYHNFHDSTSQAIRDANFKPNVPANVLGYNTYAENPVLVSAQTIVQGGTVNINLSCNNLTQEIIFLVRRKQRNIASNLQQTHQAFEDFTTTLPIKSISLTGSGQQLYQGTGAECILTDQWDFPLSSVETGCALTNDSGVYADNHASAYAQSKPTCDGFFAYRIPFSFSSDKTYNSGSIALQTINNPVLSIEFFPLHGWVINDDNLASKLPSVFNLNENMGINTELQTVFNNDFQIEIYENYWQLIRIDSNTGAVTKSLDL